MSSVLDAYRAAEQALWSWSRCTPQERLVVARRSELELRTQETGDGPAVLFVHGAMNAGASWAPLMARLPEFRCIALDRPGCGLSPEWTLSPEFREQAVGVLDDLLDALGLDQVRLVGNSLGALWCTWFAVARPHRVRHLALIGPSIGFPGVHPPLFMRLGGLPVVGAVMKRMMRPSEPMLRKTFERMGHGRSLADGTIPDELLRWGVALQEATRTQRNELDAVRRAVGFRGPRAWVQLSEEELSSLEMPVLVVSGTDDPHGGRTLAQGIADLVPQTSLHVLEGAGHLPWLDDVETVAAAIRSAWA